jgi:hypothetical protein
MRLAQPGAQVVRSPPLDSSSYVRHVGCLELCRGHTERRPARPFLGRVDDGSSDAVWDESLGGRIMKHGFLLWAANRQIGACKALLMRLWMECFVTVKGVVER